MHALCAAAFIGAIAYLGPKAGRDVFGISGETADLVFGAVTVLTGVFGTLAGGLALDRVGATMANGLRICAAGMLAGCACAVLPFFPGSCLYHVAATWLSHLFMKYDGEWQPRQNVERQRRGVPKLASWR
jgi:hypothetical protein